MARSEFETIDRLNAYWDEAIREADAESGDLDPTLAATVGAVQAMDDVPSPEPAFNNRLWQGLMMGEAPSPAVSNERRRRGRFGWPVRWPRLYRARRPLAGLAAALLVVLALGAYFGLTQPAPVSADEILRKAQEAAASPGALGVTSFVSTDRSVSRPGNPKMGAYEGYRSDDEIRSETKRWYQAPNRWRTEASGTTVDAQGNEVPGRSWSWVGVSDGKDYWRVDQNGVTVREIDVPPSAEPNSYGGESPQGTLDPVAALGRSNPRVRPVLQGEETVAGRQAYVLAFPEETRSASAPELNGPRTVWVDKETYFVLKVVQISGTDGKWLSTSEVTSIQYNVAIDPAVFTFTPPRGAKVDDQRPKPAPTKSQFQQQMETLAAHADFPVFLPGQVPDGLVPRQPRMDEAMGLQLEYVPPAEAEKDSFATMTARQQKATQSLVSNWTEGAESVEIGDAMGWLRRGVRNVDGTGTDSAVIVLRDGTLVSVSSFTLSPEDLVKVAASLAPVPGGYAPLANPTVPSLEEIRRRASFKLFLPGYVPAGLAPEPPVAGSNQGPDRIDAVTVTYHSADGAVALQIVEGPPRDAGSMARPMLTAPEVAIREGVKGRLLDAPAGQPRLLWWEQEGTFIGLESRVLSREELLKVAASMSPTAGLGQVEPRMARPIPTPVPAPSFTVLRPTWLPEQMTVREQYQPDPTGRGTQIEIGFDPRPEDTQPHGVLTLTEMTRESAGDRKIADPEAIKENIGGREVTIIMRGEDWITLWWTQGDVALSLTNPYDPPGQPRYTPEQLRKVVESIR